MPTLKRIAAGFLATLTVVTVAFGQSAAAENESYPTRSIELVVPFPAGGSDAVPRRFGQYMSEKLGQPVVIMNKPGASSIIASRAVIASKPDGHTLYVATPTELAANPSLFETVPFDALTDLTPISLLAQTPFVLLARDKAPFKNYDELIAFAKANPGKVSIGTFGAGSPPDLIAREFQRAAGIEFQMIPYQGGSQVLTGLLRGDIDLGVLTLIPTRGPIENKSILPIAITLDKRAPLIPQTPTFSEKGVKITAGGGCALMGPKNLPKPIVEKLHQVAVAMVQDPEIVKYLQGLNIVPVGSSPDELANSLRAETKYWAETIPQLGLGKRKE